MFLPADGLHLERVDVVSRGRARWSEEPTLVVDGDARPIGWAHWTNRDSSSRGVHVRPVGHAGPRDSALTSPAGLAVAVAPGTGWSAGVVPAQQILAQVADFRTPSTDSIEGHEALSEPEVRPERVKGLEEGGLGRLSPLPKRVSVSGRRKLICARIGPIGRTAERTGLGQLSQMVDEPTCLLEPVEGQRRADRLTRIDEL